jgi:Flp pilus assembly pilin Flp
MRVLARSMKSWTIIKLKDNWREEELRKFRKGQSTLEYVIILAAVVGAIIAAGGVLRTRIVNSYGTLGDKMQNEVEGVEF